MLRAQFKSAAILFVTENKSTPKHLAAANILGAELVGLDDFSANHLQRDPSLVFDVDLRSIEHVRKLKAILRHRGHGCRVFIVDPDNRVTSVHANVLGADALLPRPAAPTDIAAAIGQHFGVDARALGDPVVMQSIDAGVTTLDLSFQALVEETELDTDGVLDAGGRIADAVAGLGVEDWLATVKGHHIGTFQHCMLVTGVATAFGTRTGMARRDVVKLAVAGLLHDIGKAAVPIEILDKAGELTEAEIAVIRKHPIVGHDYLAAHSEIAADMLSSVRHHHEYLDGSGYPDQLRAEQIDDLTRIITICDIYAALIERRSYKKPTSPAQAISILDAMAAAGKVETSLVRELGRIMLPRAG